MFVDIFLAADLVWQMAGSLRDVVFQPIQISRPIHFLRIMFPDRYQMSPHARNPLPYLLCYLDSVWRLRLFIWICCQLLRVIASRRKGTSFFRLPPFLSCPTHPLFLPCCIIRWIHYLSNAFGTSGTFEPITKMVSFDQSCASVFGANYLG